MKKISMIITICILLIFNITTVEASGCSTKWGKFTVTKDTYGKITVLKSKEDLYKKDKNKMIKSGKILKPKEITLVNADIGKYLLLDNGLYVKWSSNIKFEEVPYEQHTCVINKEYNKVIDKLVKEAKKEKTKLGKIISAHKSIAGHIEYEDRGNNYREAHIGQGAILNGRAYCDGYSEALIAVLSKLGFKAVEVVSWPMNHSWVMVELDKKYYHIDPTHDDDGHLPKYEKFLLSDKELKKKGYHGWKTNLKATSDKYLNISKTLGNTQKTKVLDYKSGYFYLYKIQESRIEKISLDFTKKNILFPEYKFVNVDYKKGWYYAYETKYETPIENSTTTIVKFKVDGTIRTLHTFKGYIQSGEMNKDSIIYKGSNGVTYKY